MDNLVNEKRGNLTWFAKAIEILFSAGYRPRGAYFVYTGGE
jgi:hypothetical protein